MYYIYIYIEREIITHNVILYYSMISILHLIIVYYIIE